MSQKEIEFVLATLEAAKNVLAWYQDTYPDSFDEGDVEVNGQIETSINFLKESLSKQEQGKPVGEAYLCDGCHTPFDGAFQCPACGNGRATKEHVYTIPQRAKAGQCEWNKNLIIEAANCLEDLSPSQTPKTSSARQIAADLKMMLATLQLGSAA